jgi:hypothetical protein
MESNCQIVGSVFDVLNCSFDYFSQKRNANDISVKNVQACGGFQVLSPSAVETECFPYDLLMM